MMRARDLFGVAVRVIGVWQITEAAYWVFYAILKLKGGVGNPSITVEQDAGFAVFYLVLGLLLIVLADSIVRAVYGPPPAANEGDDR
jgi:hypothetical protein